MTATEPSIYASVYRPPSTVESAFSAVPNLDTIAVGAMERSLTVIRAVILIILRPRMINTKHQRNDTRHKIQGRARQIPSELASAHTALRVRSPGLVPGLYCRCVMHRRRPAPWALSGRGIARAQASEVPRCTAGPFLESSHRLSWRRAAGPGVLGR